MPGDLNHLLASEGEWRDRHLQQLLDSAGVGVFCAAPDGRIVRMNQAFRELTGSLVKVPKDLTGDTETFVSSTELVSFFRLVANSKSICEFELPVEGPEKRHQLLRFYAIRRKIPSQRVTWIDGVLQDISALKLAESLMEQSSRARQKLSELSLRERDVLDEVVLGAMNKTIARRFDISEKTVERHRSNLMKKLEVKSIADLVRLASLAEMSREGFP